MIKDQPNEPRMRKSQVEPKQRQKYLRLIASFFLSLQELILTLFYAVLPDENNCGMDELQDPCRNQS